MGLAIFITVTAVLVVVTLIYIIKKGAYRE